MAKQIDSYINASGVKDKEALVREYESLKQGMPELSKDSYKAALQVKDYLVSKGFDYDASKFKANDVIKSKGANCLGFPLLIGSLMAEQGHDARYKLIVSPQDYTYQDETENILPELKDSIRYDNPKLAVIQEDLTFHRFHPLEHLVLDVNGGVLIDTTPGEIYSTPGFEAGRDLTFDQALALVHKDIAVEEAKKGNFDQSYALIKKAIKGWKENREAYSLLASLAIQNFDDDLHRNAQAEYLKQNGDDSLFNFTKYAFNGDVKSLERALTQYPAFAQALTAKADLTSQKEEGEARVEYAIASQLFSKSGVVNLAGFYIDNKDKLAHLFGREKVIEALSNFEDQEWGNFDYHLAMYSLTGSEQHLDEAREQCTTPLQSTQLLSAQKTNQKPVDSEISQLSDRFKNSKLYSQLVNLK